MVTDFAANVKERAKAEKVLPALLLFRALTRGKMPRTGLWRNWIAREFPKL
jgi:hypothetical protein